MSLILNPISNALPFSQAPVPLDVWAFENRLFYGIEETGAFVGFWQSKYSSGYPRILPVVSWQYAFLTFLGTR